MKDNDLLVTQVFEDPAREPITAMSAYFTKSSKYGELLVINYR